MDNVNWDFNAPTHIDFSSKEHVSENITEIEDYFSKFYPSNKSKMVYTA